MNNKNNQKLSKNWWIEFFSLIIITYLIFSLISPMFINEGQNLPRKIEASDIILIAVILLFNSGLLNRIENFGVSKDGGVTANFQKIQEISKQVENQGKNISELQQKQLEQLEKEQEKMQSFMIKILLGKKDFEKIYQLNEHSENKTSYDFYVSDRVGDELRRLRDLELIALKDDKVYISDIVRASNNGKNSIDLTQYFYLTDLGKDFLKEREKLYHNLETDI